MAGKAFSTRTGGVPSLAFIPHTRVPVYASFSRILWAVVMRHVLPLGVATPSALRGLGHLHEGLSLEHHVEDAAHDGVGGRVEFKPGTLLGPVLHVDTPIPEGGNRMSPRSPWTPPRAYPA